MNEFVAFGFLILGIFFSFFGALGVIRFPDVYLRLHSGAVCTTTGILSIFIGLIILEGWNILSARIMVMAIFTFVTSAIISHAIGRSAYECGVIPWGRRKK